MIGATNDSHESVDTLLARMKAEKVRFATTPGGTELALIPKDTVAIPEDIQELARRHKPALLHIAAATDKEGNDSGRPHDGEDVPLRAARALPKGDRAVIDAGNHDLPVVTEQAWHALEARNDPPFLFHHGGAPARLQHDPDGRPILVPLTEHRLRCEVALAAHWQVMKTRGGHTFPVAAEPPLTVIQNMLAQPTLPLPILRRIAETPVFAPDGRLIEAAGYDAPSGVYLHPAAGLSIPPVPERPTAQDVASARALICDELLGDFPFVTDADRAAAVALLILPFVREMIDGPTPMHGIESATVGSGKGLLMDACTHPAFGGHGGLLTEARDDDEWRKWIGAKLREGAPIIQIDNLTRLLDSGALASALTAAVFTDRLLGRNQSFTAPVRCVWVYAANNPMLSTEIARRTIRCRIDPKMDRPWQRRDFTHQHLRAWGRSIAGRWCTPPSP